jgi:hypothetical protein
MSLGDVMSTSGLTVFAEIGLLLSACVFLYVIATTLARRNQPAFERARFMPLADDVPAGADQGPETQR